MLDNWHAILVFSELIEITEMSVTTKTAHDALGPVAQKFMFLPATHGAASLGHGL